MQVSIRLKEPGLMTVHYIEGVLAKLATVTSNSNENPESITKNLKKLTGNKNDQDTGKDVFTLNKLAFYKNIIQKKQTG